MSPETLLGMELGQSVLKRLLGQGTMGAVYLASQGDRQVALKVFLPAATLEQIEQEEFLKRLEDIISHNATLKHPHILATLGHGRQNGLVYQIMPFNAGESLDTRLKRSGALPFTQIQTYLAQLASALDYAHANGILHRDLKPSNILLAPDGNLLLSDFALAGLTTEKNFAKTRRAMTGMLNTIAPEYVLGKAIDPRTDLYSLGAVLYQMVTGASLFEGSSLSEIAMKQVKATPALPRSLRPDLPQAAEQVIMRALAKRPADRYSHARDLASAFRLALEATVLPTRPPEPNALAQLANLANNGNTADRITAPRRGGLFDPKWQSQGSLPAVGSQLGPNFNATVPLASDSSLSEANALGLQGNTNVNSQLSTGSTESQQEAKGQTSAKSPTQFVPPTPFGLKAQYANLLAPTRNAHQTDALPPDVSQQDTASQDAIRLPNQPAEATSSSEELSSASLKPASTPTDAPGAFSDLSDENERSTTSSLKLADITQTGADQRQTGQMLTDFLPTHPVDEQVEISAKKRGSKHKEKRGGKRRAILNLLAAALVLIAGVAGVAVYLNAHGHSSPPPSQPKQLTAAMRAKIQATATARANVIFSDNLSQNTNGWPVGLQGWYTCVFTDGAYHITNQDKSKNASVIAPMKGSNGPFVYTLTMEQIQGDETDPNNQFGMILNEHTQMIGGNRVATFYAFEILNRAGGQYQFWKYDGTKTGNPWSEVWSKGFGSEFLQGSGPTHINTVAVASNGTMFTFTVNGTQVGTLHDSSFASGSVGMLVNLDGAEIAFSHLLVAHT